MSTKQNHAQARQAALDVLQAIAADPAASPATRAQAARAILEATRPAARINQARGSRVRVPAATRTPEELRQALELVQARKRAS